MVLGLMGMVLVSMSHGYRFSALLLEVLEGIKSPDEFPGGAEFRGLYT
jgi:hypothetical protein